MRAAITTGDRIKCWGRATNAAATANGVFLNSAAGTNHLADLNTGGEQGNGLPYVNHLKIKNQVCDQVTEFSF